MIHAATESVLAFLRCRGALRDPKLRARVIRASELLCMECGAAMDQRQQERSVRECRRQLCRGCYRETSRPERECEREASRW